MKTILVVTLCAAAAVLAGCRKDPVKQAEQNYLSKGDLAGAIQYLESEERDIDCTYENRVAIKTKLNHELYPRFHRQNAALYLSKGNESLSRQDYARACAIFELIPSEAPEYEQARPARVEACRTARAQSNSREADEQKFVDEVLAAVQPRSE